MVLDRKGKGYQFGQGRQQETERVVGYGIPNPFTLENLRTDINRVAFE